MSDDSYNEGLKHPLFYMHPADPRVVAESKRLLGASTLQDRVRDFFCDTLGIPESNTSQLKRVAHTVVMVPEQDLVLPFQQLSNYHLKPATHVLQKESKTHRPESLTIGFERVKSGLKVWIDIYG